jgi:hypothetical protein
VTAVTTTLWTCRRCGAEETVQGTGRPRNWVTAKFVGLNPPTTVTDIGDLCNQCGGYLVSFVHGTDVEDIARDKATDLALAEVQAQVDADMADEIWRTGRLEQWGRSKVT